MKEQLDKISLAPAKKKEVTESSVAPSESPKAVKIIDSLGRSYGTGRRKNSVARVWIKPGTGKISVNKKEFSEYFARSVLRMITLQPLEVTKTLGHFDIMCTVKGGGLSGQAGAMRLGISRALDHFDPDAHHKILRQSGFLTRDQRVVERKKYGQPKARKKFQFSKR